MHRQVFAFLSATLCAPHVVAAAPVSAPLTPSGPWHIEYADSMCLLSRPYVAKPEVRLIIKPSMIGDKLELIVMTAKTNLRPRRSGGVAMANAEEPVADELSYSAYSTAKARLVRIRSAKESLTLAALRDTLTIDAKGEVSHRFSLPGLQRARPALNACLDQLRAIYKVSPTDLAPIATEPKASVVSFFSTSDYPIPALRKNESGTVGVLLWIEPSGRVSTCEVIEPIASEALEQQTCNVLTRRARFTPAKDAAGNAIRAPSTARITWQLPD